MIFIFQISVVFTPSDLVAKIVLVQSRVSCRYGVGTSLAYVWYNIVTKSTDARASHGFQVEEIVIKLSAEIWKFALCITQPKEIDRSLIDH